MTLPSNLFHGTINNFDKPKASNYDGVFWTADCSTIAQNYIPQSIGNTHTNHVFENEMNQLVKPHQNDSFYAVVLLMGFEASDVKHDRIGKAISFSCKKDYPRYKDVIKYIENTLGYTSLANSPKSYELKTSGWDSESRHEIISNNNFNQPGFLFIIQGHEKMKIYDMTTERGDLQEPQCNEIGKFESLQKKGYDGVIINDFCQSKVWGNVGHKSVGFFTQAIPDLNFEKIPACNFEWGASPKDFFGVTETPQYKTWLNAKKAARIIPINECSIKEYSFSELRAKSRTAQI
jgi:hypothetical protein